MVATVQTPVNEIASHYAGNWLIGRRYLMSRLKILVDILDRKCRQQLIQLRSRRSCRRSC